MRIKQIFYEDTRTTVVSVCLYSSDIAIIKNDCPKVLDVLRQELSDVDTLHALLVVARSIEKVSNAPEVHST